MTGQVPLKELFSLAGKCAVVTGGAAGIGLAVSFRLAEAGAKVCIVDIDGPKAEEAVKTLLDQGYKASSFACDITSEARVIECIDNVSRENRIDILVNSAGVYPRSPFLETSPDTLDAVFAVNVRGLFLCSREVSQRMVSRGLGGSIVNIASIEGVRPASQGHTAYGASKGAVLALTRSMAKELAGDGIRVNAVVPGGIKTGAAMLQAGSAKEGRDELRRFLADVPLGRMGDPDEVARAVLFLASEMSSYITGSQLVVDGGYLMG